MPQLRRDGIQICFFGLSGTGKSTLLAALAERYPHDFWMPPRLSTRAPKTGDRPHEIRHLTPDELRAMEARGELLEVMLQNARRPSSSLSAYAWADLEDPRWPLLACSVHNLDSLRRRSSVLTVHVASDWRTGIARRGGVETVARTALNEELEDLFTHDALGRFVDVVFEHRFEGAALDAERLFTRLCEAAAARGLHGTRLDAAPVIAAANVRAPWRSWGRTAVIEAGIGREGELVLGVVAASPDRPTKVFAQDGGAYELLAPAVVLAPLGNRESSTHVNGGVPADGLPIGLPGAPALAWIAQESGLVGQLFTEPGAHAGAEASIPFRALGLVTADGQRVSVARLARSPKAEPLSLPVIAIAGTSAEAGKTTLAEKLIKALHAEGRKVGAIKATGTGGTTDSRRHRAAGAHVALDQVDGGMASTYVSEEVFLQRALDPLRLARDAGADVLVVELGGDLPSANNPALLRELEARGLLRHLFVICNDSLAALGVKAWIRGSLGSLDDARWSLVASPFRNLRGFRARAAALALPDVLSPEDVSPLVARVQAGPARPAPPNLDIDASAGQAGVLTEFWRRHGDVHALLLLGPTERTAYELDSAATALGTPRPCALEAQLRQLHVLAANASTDHAHLVLGAGARQLVNACLYGLWRLTGEEVNVRSAAPYYPFHGRLAGMAPGIAKWCDGALPTGGTVLEVVCTPANPTGEARVSLGEATLGVHDLAYHWPHLAPRGLVPLACRDDAVMVFSLAKLTGHAASRVGWAWVREGALAREMRRFIRHDTIGPSGDGLARAETLVGALLRDDGRLWSALVREVPATMAHRWERLSPILARAGLDCQSRLDGWCYAWLRVTDAQREQLEALGVRGYPGESMGAPGFVRLNVMSTSETFESLLERLGRMVP